MMAALLSFNLNAQNKPAETQIHYLSGKGADDAVEWDFFCTEGRNSGKWDKIKVPSCWELQGYGKFQYGINFYGKAFPDGVAAEKGMYKHEFEVPAEWHGKKIELVFEASMTDTEVKVNGRKAGSKHQGAFYRFSYDVTDLLKFGKKNLLEVTVSKESENAGVNLAERRADYWNFGGIFRPVFLQVRPAHHIDHLAIDAQADGSFKANCYLNNAAGNDTKIKAEIFDLNGKKLAEKTMPVKQVGVWTAIEMNLKNPALWTAETPNLYKAQFTLLNGKDVLHQTTEKFGFRTIEVRESDGMYINGVRVNIRGVNRHSFRPETGRTLSREKNYEDVRLIKEMNMNSVRLSHYPADPEFLEACDELGLYVMNELGGWHGKYDTPTGVKLIEGMIERDVNHPSVIWWSNGNEKGWNTELDGEFHKWDPQKRPVIHPQGNFGGFETMHYRSYGESQNYMRLPEIFMPTEFLHGLYDGGHGAGLYDYWEMMRKHPRCIGGFLWVLADEGVKRVDENGRIDNQGNYGADGIVGPNHEKEGSFYTVKQIWSPVQIMDNQLPATFDGAFTVENRYDFTNLNTCRFTYQLVDMPEASDLDGKTKVINEGSVKGPDVAPHQAGMLKLNLSNWSKADALYLTATDKSGAELWRWGWNLNDYKEKSHPTDQLVAKGNASYQVSDAAVEVKAGDMTYTFSKKDGELKKVTRGEKEVSFANGPRFTAARRADRSLDQFYNHDDETAKKKDRTYTEFTDAAVLNTIDVREENGSVVVDVKYKLGNLQSVLWRIAPNGKAQLDYAYSFDGVVELMGIKFDYPEDKVVSKRWLGAGPYRVWQNRLHGTTYDVWENNYNDPIPGESFLYPEFKGYFADWQWVNLKTTEGVITLQNRLPENDQYLGIYQPRDGRDALLYTLPQTGISVLDVIPAVRNKVNSTDLCGPSSQAKWVSGVKTGSLQIDFNI
ncbi:MAG: glycoside hydrolase family 2 TIM barrel-domain containing protein [Bacteroidales bacterium]